MSYKQIIYKQSQIYFDHKDQKVMISTRKTKKNIKLKVYQKFIWTYVLCQYENQYLIGVPISWHLAILYSIKGTTKSQIGPKIIEDLKINYFNDHPQSFKEIFQPGWTKLLSTLTPQDSCAVKCDKFSCQLRKI